MGIKACGRCGFPQGMRSKKCKDKDHCTFVMIKSAEYKKKVVKSTADRNAVKEVYDARLQSYVSRQITIRRLILLNCMKTTK